MTQKLHLNPFAKSSTTRTRWLPGVGDNLRPAFKRLAKDLRLVERARSEGAENRPDKSDLDLDESQRQVVAEIQSGAHLLKQFLQNQLRDAEEKIRARFPRQLDATIAVTDARAAVGEAKLAHGGALESLRLAERRALRGFRKFKADNKLSRAAAYAREWYLPAATLAALWAIESIANAGVFYQAVEGGATAAIALALLFGAVNVLLGLGAGFVGFRLLGHVKSALKLLGGLATISTSAADLAWNVMVAHYRDAIERNPDAASFLDPSFAAAPNSWFAFTSIQAWALLLLGVAVFAAVAIKARGGRGGFVDPYPGYRSIDLTHREADGLYAHAQEDYKEAVRQAYADTRSSLQGRHEADGKSVSEILEIADQAELRAAEVRDSISEWAEAGCALLRSYREENRAVRTAPEPSYFSRYPSFDELKSAVPDASSVRVLASSGRTLHEANAKALAEAKELLANGREQETKLLLAEIDEIETRAERRLESDWADEPSQGPDVSERRPTIREVA